MVPLVCNKPEVTLCTDLARQNTADNSIMNWHTQDTTVHDPAPRRQDQSCTPDSTTVGQFVQKMSLTIHSTRVSCSINTPVEQYTDTPDIRTHCTLCSVYQKYGTMHEDARNTTTHCEMTPTLLTAERQPVVLSHPSRLCPSQDHPHTAQSFIVHVL
jgi:hypothetical protein